MESHSTSSDFTYDDACCSTVSSISKGIIQKCYTWAVSIKITFHTLSFSVANSAICANTTYDYFLFCSDLGCLIIYLSNKVALLCSFSFALRYLFTEIVCDIWAWHSVNGQGIIGTRLSAVCLMPCLLWKSPWNRRSKYPHWSRGRGPNDDVVAKSHGSKSSRQ